MISLTKFKDPNDFEPINKPGIEDAREALQVLEDFGLFSKFGESMLKSLKELNNSLDREELSHKKQSVVTSFFSKQFSRLSIIRTLRGTENSFEL